MSGSSYYKGYGVSNPQEGGSETNVPKGGITGQRLVKKSNFDYDMKWETEEPRQLIENKYSTVVYESASISGISEERSIAYAIALGGE